MRKKILLLVICLLVTCFTTISLAATREELAAIRVGKSGNFQYWTDKSPAKKALINYVNSVTKQKSSDYIPTVDRIAVFDMDGTLMCETAPTYFDEAMYHYRVSQDPSWQPTNELKEEARKLATGDLPGMSAAEQDLYYGRSQAKAFAGMSLADYKKYVQKFMAGYTTGLTNLKRGEAFYLPMIEVVRYLQANDFTIYLVSGCDRMVLRVLADGILPISPRHIIGTDTNFVASHQNGESGVTYQLRDDDVLVRGDYLVTDVKMNKVSAMVKEIGQQPVIAFGNSSGDFSMYRYTTTHNKYKTAVFTLVCDDQEREFGKPQKAAAMVKSAAENGWTSVSMKNDFKTIYGPNVKKTATVQKAN